MRLAKVLASSLLGLPLIGSLASAAEITRIFDGTVSVAYVNGISAGESFAATLVYDDAAPFNCGESFNCFYPAISLQVDFQNGASLVDDIVSIHVETANPSSSDDVFTVTGSSASDPGTSIRFEDPEGNALVGGAHLPDLNELNSPDWNTRRLSHTSEIGQPLQGDVFLVTPEPSSVSLLFVALIGLAGWRRVSA